MKTILYNTTDFTVTHHAQEGYYKVDGVRPTLPDSIVELEVVNATRPTYNTATHKLVHTPHAADLQNNLWVDSYTVVALSANELALIGWKYPSYPKKLVINDQVAKTALGMFHFMRFEKLGNPVEYDDVAKKWNVWITEINSTYKPDFDALKDAVPPMLTIEDIPSILTQ